MSIRVVLAGVCAGLGCFLLIRELIPAPPRLDAALARLAADATAEPSARASHRLARRVVASVPWLPVPSADLRLLGRDTETWVASKVALGLLGLAVPAALSALLALGGVRCGWTVPVAVSLAMGVVFFMAPHDNDGGPGGATGDRVCAPADLPRLLPGVHRLIRPADLPLGGAP